MIKLAIVEDNTALRQSLEQLFNRTSNMKCVASLNNLLNVVSEFQKNQPDIVLMDIGLPSINGIEGVRTVKSNFENIQVIMFTVFEDDEKLFQCLCAGANGYLLKSADPAEIKKAIMEVMSKGYYLNNFVNRILLKKSHARQKVAPTITSEITLSDREREVVKYICMEFTAHEIAQKLEVSPRTVEAIKDRLMERFGAKNTAGLVFFAVKNNLID